MRPRGAPGVSEPAPTGPVSDGSPAANAGRGLGARPILANTGALVAIRGTNLAVRLGLLFLIARQVSPQDFGRLVLALSVAEVAKVAADFGMDTLAIREFALARDRAATAAFAASFAACRLACGAIVQVGVASWFALTQPALQAAVGVVLSFTVWTSLLQSFSLDWFQARLRVARVLVPAVGTTVLAGMAAALATGRIAELPAKAACLPALELLSGVVLLSVLRTDAEWGFGRPSGAAMRRLVLASVPVAFTAFLIMTYSRLDVFVLASRVPPVDIGRYGIAFRLTEPFQMAATVFAVSVYSRFVPLLAAGAGPARALALRYAGGTIGYGAAVALGLLLLAPPAIERLLPAYAGAVPPLRILAGALVFRSLNATLAAILQAAGRFRGLAVLAAWNLAFVFGMLLLFVPRLGVEGAALALLVGEGVNSLVQAGWVARIVTRGAAPTRGHA